MFTHHTKMKTGYDRYSPNVTLLIPAVLAISVPLNALKKLALHLGRRRRRRGSRVALWVPIAHLLSVRIRVLGTAQGL